MQYCTTFGQPITTCIYLLNENNDKGALRINKYFFSFEDLYFTIILDILADISSPQKCGTGNPNILLQICYVTINETFIKRHHIIIIVDLGGDFEKGGKKVP